MQGDNGAVVEEGQAIAAAQQLVNEAQALSVKVDREVEKLREVRHSPWLRHLVAGTRTGFLIPEEATWRCMTLSKPTCSVSQVPEVD